MVGRGAIKQTFAAVHSTSPLRPRVLLGCGIHRSQPQPLLLLSFCPKLGKHVSCSCSSCRSSTDQPATSLQSELGSNCPPHGFCESIQPHSSCAHQICLHLYFIGRKDGDSPSACISTCSSANQINPASTLPKPAARLPSKWQLCDWTCSWRTASPSAQWQNHPARRY